MASVGNGIAGRTLIGTGVTASPTFAPIGTSSSLTNHGVIIGGGSGAFTATSTGAAGQILQSSGPGANPVYTTATYPSTSGASGNILTSDGTNWISSPNTFSFNPSTSINIYEEFLGSFVSTNNYAGQTGWFMTSFSGSAFTSVSPTSNQHPGVIQSQSLTVGITSVVISMGNAPASFYNIKLGGGAISLNYIINVATLSTGTNTYTLYLGLGKGAITTAEATDGVYFTYTNALNSGNWVGKTASASSRSSANSAVAVSAGTWVNLGITINAAATSVGFYINGVQIANSPLAANISTAELVPYLQMVWSLGTVPANAVLIDAFYMTQTFTTPR